ncbi:MAG: DUF1565 domain-containing protein [Deltaproteobacteria bacterium]|nr:DUF1565 domain-containing protein [Deltaproteobacteria bacterium]
MRLDSLVLAGVAAVALSCSSSEFSLAGVDAEADTGQTTDAAGDSVPIGDSAPTVDEGVPGESGTVDANAPCSVLAPAATVIYVDARNAREPVGTADCPFKSIREALSYVAGQPSAKRTIKVAGGTATAPLVYNETAGLVVKAATSIVGDGAERVTVTGGGACLTAQCVFLMEGGSTIEGVTINGGARIGLAMIPVAFSAVTARRMVVTDSKGTGLSGVVVNGKGTVDLGPEFRSTRHTVAGLYVDEIFSVRVIAGGTIPNAFNENGGGIVLSRGFLNFEAGEVRGNAANGIAILSNVKSTISNLVAKDNGAAGVLVEGSASLKMRSSMLVKNRVGLVFRYGTNELDLGTATDFGKNIFGGPSASNNKAAICLPHARTEKSPAVGNKWLVCGPTFLPLATETCETLSGYQDIRYAPSVDGAGIPFDATGCDVGP